MKVNTNVSNKTRRELVLDDFKGVDFSSSPLKISGNRASRMSNLICDNGVNHKRPGWEQLLKLGSKINGIYEYNCGGHHALIIYAGKTFYRSVISKDTYDEPENIYENDNLIDQKVQFFLQKERLYIIGCGDYLVYGTWIKNDDLRDKYELYRVADAPDTYVPTVMTGGTPRQTRVVNGVNEDTMSELAGILLEETNILRRDGRRKEIFINNKTGASNTHRTYFTSVNFKKEDFKISVNGTSFNFPESINNTYTFGDGEFSFQYHSSESECSGFKTSGLSLDYEEGAHIEVEYTPADYSNDKSKYIEKCTFGTRFGAYGNSDRLFLSGNPDMPNADFYSGFDDFTYFTAKSQTVMGSKDVPITGYLRLSDSTLATLKAETNTEPTIYYRTATETEVELENGQKTYDVGFTRWTGGINEGCVNPYCTALFADDNLMLSPNGVRGIVQIANSATNERYVRERDKFINDNLLTHDLTNAVSIVYKNRYYLAVDGVCYVADPRYKTYVKDDIDGSFNYEWWYWENIPARVFAIINGELWFGTEDGRICRFYNAFVDKSYDETVNGQITADGGIMISDEEMDVAVCVGDEIRLGGYNYPLYVVDKDESTFKVSKEKNGNAVTNIVKNIFNDNPPVPIKMKVYCYKNVVSEWYSPVFDLGAFDVSKTLLSMSITVDPNVKGRVKFGYSTRDNLGLEMPYSHSEGSFDFDNLNFNYISFDAPFAASRTVRVKVRNFNYIMFKLISDTDEDCAVCNLKAVYQYNGRLKGVH